MIKKFWHSGLTVDDLEESITQYQKLGFSLKEKFNNREPKAKAAHMTHADGGAIELWQWLDASHPYVQYIKSHTAFISDDPDADVSELVKLGGKIVIPKTEVKGLNYTFVRDRSDNYIEIAQFNE